MTNETSTSSPGYLNITSAVNLLPSPSPRYPPLTAVHNLLPGDTFPGSLLGSYVGDHDSDTGTSSSSGKRTIESYYSSLVNHNQSERAAQHFGPSVNASQSSVVQQTGKPKNENPSHLGDWVTRNSSSYSEDTIQFQNYSTLSSSEVQSVSSPTISGTSNPPIFPRSNASLQHFRDGSSFTSKTKELKSSSHPKSSPSSLFASKRKPYSKASLVVHENEPRLLPIPTKESVALGSPAVLECITNAYKQYDGLFWSRPGE